MITPSARADASPALVPQPPHPATWVPPRASVTPLRVAEPVEPAAGDERPVGRAHEIRAIIADGQRLVRSGLRRLFEEQRDIAVTGEAENGDQLMALVRSAQPDVVVIDAGLPGVDGFEVTRRILAESPSRAVGVVLLVGGEDDEVVLAALEAGAGGVLAKESEAPEFLRAVRVVAHGGATLGPELTPRLIAWLLCHTACRGEGPAELSELTPRERQVMALVAAGLSNDEIAERLVVTPATAKTHVSRARRKVGARDRAQLVVYAYRNGLVAAPRAVAEDGEAGVVRQPRARWTTPASHEERRSA
ncbi:MAG TPA: response regulator transcription factor [Baekduia sp.]|uniref:response regulator transcription factor n=1 Tax=Baekduia sp. TaxID=2600305 RepID=UPI002CE5E74C|nr:response regulator transcription factor [Baekduia sp.]HMJ34296.1 response regulator transcription factor [Baekduia sp.]